MATKYGWRLAAVAALGLAAAARAVPPIAAFGHLPSVDLIAISPDGSKLAMVVSDAHGRQMQVRRVTDNGVIHVANVGLAKVRALQWAGDDHLLLTRSTTAEVTGLTGPKREYFLVADFNLATVKLTPLLQTSVGDKVQRMNTINGEPMVRMVKGRAVAFLPGVTFPSSEGVLTLFAVDLDAQRTREIAVGSTDTNEFLVGPDGSVVARVDYNQRAGRWTLSTARGATMVKSMDDTRPLDSPWLAGFGRTTGSVLVGSYDDDDTAYREVPLGATAPSPSLPELANATPVTDPRTGVTIGASHHEDLSVEYDFLDPADAALWARVKRGFGSAVVHLESWSDDRTKIILRAEGKVHGAAYFLLDVPGKRATWLANEYAEIDPEDLGEKRSIHYPAADGTDIPAYLTLPPGVADARRLPLVVLPHGGPSARDDPGFDWWAQALASRGYAVLQPQFRGSTGFGGHFLAAGYGEWGKKMQTDLSDGVAYLAKAGMIDPKRVAIVGGSYGGYAALAGVTLQQGLYRCAVSLAGPADLKRMLDYEETATGGTRNRTLRHWKRFMGAKSASDPVLATISPLTFAARADAPVLLIHGLDDTVVPFDQSKVMAAALTKAGKPVELVRLTGEDHWLSRGETRTAMLTATAAFLAKYLPADPPAAPAKVAAAP